MFDTGLPGPEDLAGADDSLVIAAITGWACVEAAASARRLAAIAELVRRRAEGPTDCAQWSCDNWDSMAAEVAAALHVSHGMASGQMYLSVALRDRLPKVAALFLEGMLSARLVAAIVWRTDLITDEAIRFGPLSVVKTNEAIDAIIDQYDPPALRRTRAAARGRQAVIDSGHGRHGTTAFWGTLFSTDAAMLDRRLTQMASVSNWHGDSFVYIGAGYRGHRVPTHRWSTTWLERARTGFVMGVGLVLDTFLVRTITVPALAVLIGKGNWWPSKWRPSKQPERARVDRDASVRVTVAAASKKATAAHPSDQVTPARASDQGSAADPSDQRAMAGRSSQLAAAGAGLTAWVWTSSSAQNWLRRRSALDGS